ncbi:hypothetical protein EXU48_06255 [Occultella glacieicola]|uniref:Uncharacterized protein n=1 Tax=Occultella glacieicola TaxID=2518684 RepID=A0ABY2E726_9MICO|nr:hypothetical protein [Occultella glacieicola]TDE95859.1 hypothetical protein EXU48_06255 [Occultella glacieicola]
MDHRRSPRLRMQCLAFATGLLVAAATGSPGIGEPHSSPERPYAMGGYSARPAQAEFGPRMPSEEEPPGLSVGADQVAALIALEETSLLNGYTDVYAGSQFDQTSRSLFIYYDDRSASDRLAEFLNAASIARAMATGYDLVLERVPANQDALHGLALAISTNDQGSWSSTLGVGEISAVHCDPRTGTLTVDAVVGPSSQTSEFTIDGIRVVINPVAEEGPAIENQSRDDDSQPWSGGASLRWHSGLSSSAYCTAGFAWRRWSTGEYYSSTAEHCWGDGERPNWYNWGTFLGSIYLYSKQVDTMMLRTNPASQVAPNVFVGGNNTTTVRWVTGASPGPSISQVVALSGGNGGLTVTEVVGTGSYSDGVGPMVTTAMSTCVDGDSGSPILTTSGTNATAHGQHKGRWTTGFFAGHCLFLPVVNISAALNVSILTL